MGIGYYLMIVVFIQYTGARGPPRLVSEVTQRQVARVGETIRLSCPVEADPAAFLQWTKDGESIHRGWERFKILSLALRIKEAETEDSGIYECKATNGFGHVSIDYILIVLHANQSEPPPEDDMLPPSSSGSPRFSRPDKMTPSHVMRPVGTSVTLRCKAEGFPIPTINWYKDNHWIDIATLQDRRQSGSWRFISEYENNDWDDGYNLGTDVWSLQLSSLQETDSGQYKCVVGNSHAEISHTYTLTIIEESKTKPILLAPNPRNLTVEVGEMASFMCEVHSDDIPHIQWLKRIEAPISPAPESSVQMYGMHFMVLRTTGEVLSRPDGSFLNKLTLVSVTERDTGMYVCLGANIKGYNTRSAFLTVLPEGYISGMDTMVHETTSFWDSKALPIIIGIPAAVIIIIIIIVICIIKRKQTQEMSPPPGPATVRVQRYVPPPGKMYSVQAPEKSLEHQYAALHPQYTDSGPPYTDSTSQDHMIKLYNSDKQSDSSSYRSPGHTSGSQPAPGYTTVTQAGPGYNTQAAGQLLNHTPANISHPPNIQHTPAAHTHIHYFQRT